ncbi:hypothetical protein B0T18DRAFT_424405 [Schizothecium vesticola]|uniref:Uncharacterized protein n=1 Tax=Schizothecium vesticola TaxID=314040 RepID=A0AA40FAY3_9PEZI|nr:hypothetical protein B0T18DRAFT_424405 [Schizothecium vesticola]
MQEQFHRGYGVAQHHQDDIDDEAYAQHQQSGGDELPIGEAAEFGQGDYGGGQHHPDDLNAQLLFNPGGEMPDAEASGYDRWGPGTSQAEVDSQVASAQHYHQAIDDDEAGPSGQGPPLPAPSLLKVHINARNKITRVTRYRHPDAIFPVLCQSVADRVHHSVERLRDRCPVFTENGKIAYSTKRTRLFCAEEDEYRELGDWHNVEFYIVSGLKERFDYNMLIPLQYDWGADEAQ